MAVPDQVSAPSWNHLSPGHSTSRALIGRTLSKDEAIEPVLKLQRTAKTSSKPRSTDRKERRAQSRSGRAKPGHEGHTRIATEDPDTVFDRRPTECPDCGLALSPDLAIETVSVHEHIVSPKVKPVVEQHRRLAVVCPRCRTRVAAPRRAEAAASPFVPRLHATAVDLKTFQALSYERLEKAFFDLFGLRIGQGGLTDVLRRAETQRASTPGATQPCQRCDAPPWRPRRSTASAASWNVPSTASRAACAAPAASF